MKNREDKNYIFRPVSQKDSKRLWEIRNQPAVRRKSNNSAEISWDSHKIWFKKKYFSGEKNHCFVLADGQDLAIGYCRLDYDKKKNSYITSIAMDLAYIGRGLGYELLNKALKKFHSKKNVLAEIKKENVRSIKLFQKNNFKIYKEDEKNYYLKHIS